MNLIVDKELKCITNIETANTVSIPLLYIEAGYSYSKNKDSCTKEEFEVFKELIENKDDIKGMCIVTYNENDIEECITTVHSLYYNMSDALVHILLDLIEKRVKIPYITFDTRDCVTINTGDVSYYTDAYILEYMIAKRCIKPDGGNK